MDRKRILISRTCLGLLGAGPYVMNQYSVLKMDRFVCSLVLSFVALDE